MRFREEGDGSRVSVRFIASRDGRKGKREGWMIGLGWAGGVVLFVRDEEGEGVRGGRWMERGWRDRAG